MSPLLFSFIRIQNKSLLCILPNLSCLPSIFQPSFYRSDQGRSTPCVSHCPNGLFHKFSTAASTVPVTLPDKSSTVLSCFTAASVSSEKTSTVSFSLLPPPRTLGKCSYFFNFTDHYHFFSASITLHRFL